VWQVNVGGLSTGAARPVAADLKEFVDSAVNGLSCLSHDNVGLVCLCRRSTFDTLLYVVTRHSCFLHFVRALKMGDQRLSDLENDGRENDWPNCSCD